MKALRGKIAVVAGASRGCGRGIAMALGEAGATVFVTGRTTRGGPPPVDGAPGTVEDTAAEVTERGGQGIAVRLDHTDAAQVRQFFGRVRESHGRLDLLVSAVWGGNERYLDPVWKQAFWEQPSQAWGEFLDAGPRAFWLAAREAAALIANSGGGLMVAISEPVTTQFEGQQPALIQTFQDLAHHAINQLIRTLAADARSAGIAIVGLLPGFMRTERVQMHLPDEESRQRFRYDLSESPEYAGRAVAALLADREVVRKSGQLLYVADLAEEYGFTDVDGRRIGNFYRLTASSDR